MAITSDLKRSILSIEDLDALAAEAQAALSNGDWTKAVAAYESLVEARPEELELSYKLARAYEELGEFQEAIAVLTRPTLTGLHQTKRMLASANMKAKDYAAALPLVEDLIAVSPDDPLLGKWKARCEVKISSRRLAERTKEAKALASADRFAEAEQAFVAILADYPTAAEPHWRLAQIYLLQGRWADAVPLFRSSLAIETEKADLKFGLARALFKSGEPAEAVAILETLDDSFKDRDALFLQQRCHMELRDWSRAAEVGARLLTIVPADDPLNATISQISHDALAELELERLEPFEDAVEANQAIAQYKDIADRYPSSSVAWWRFGAALAVVERFTEAAMALRQALVLRPGELAIRAALTRVVLKGSDEQNILDYVHGAIAAGTADAECYRWLARYWGDLGEWRSSLENNQKALLLEPENAPTQLRKAWALYHLGRWPEALNELEILIPLDVKSAETLQLKADILFKLARVEDSIRLYELALQKAPKDPLISYKLSQALLLNGDIEGFHRFHERRREIPAFAESERNLSFQAWDGELSIPGKLLIWAESGFGVGQTLFHAAFIEPLVRLEFDVVLEVDAPLVGIFRRSFPAIAVIPTGGQLPSGISHHSPLGSLSRWFKPDLASFASARPYLVPDVELIAAHRARLKKDGAEANLLIGIWGITEDAPCGAVDPIDGDALLDAIAVPGVTVVDLGNGTPAPATKPARGTAGHVADSGADGEDDFDELSALVAAMDLVVCVDHPSAHLAGAIGTPAFVLLPAVPAAYWLARGDRALGYPGTKLFRAAPVDLGWQAVLDRVGDAVSEFVNSYNSEAWLAGTLVPALRPRSGRLESMSPAEICDAIAAFIVQGSFAQTAYRSALELIDRLPPQERSIRVQIQHGDLLARFGRWDEARATYAALLAEDSDSRDLTQKILSISLAMYDLEYALLVARRMSAEEPAYRIVAANILYQMRREDEALAELRVVSIEKPQGDGIGNLVGTILLEVKAYERAEAYLNNQAAISRQAEDYTLLGRSISAQGRHDEALNFYDKALELSEDDPAANYWRTKARIELGIAQSVPLPPLLGNAPDVAREDIVLFFAADSRFFWKHGLALLGSASKRSPRTKCHVHIINPDTGVASALEVIRSILPEIGISYSYERADFSGCSEDHIRTYYASVRFVRLAEIFARSPATYLCVDADCIVRDDIGKRAASLDVTDVGLRLRFAERPHATVAAGALLLRPTDAAAKFIERVSSLIRGALEAREAVWFLDQIVLSQVARELGDGEVEISQLEMIYIDWFFQDHSLIWTGKGRRKSGDSRYLNEVEQYCYLQDDERVSKLLCAFGNFEHFVG